MEQSQLLAHCGTRKLTREELTAVPTPEGTSTHRPVPHHEIVGGLVETLSFRPKAHQSRTSVHVLRVGSTEIDST